MLRTLAIILIVLLSAAWIWYDVARDRPVGRWGLLWTVLGAIGAFLIVSLIWPGWIDFVFLR